MGLSESKQTPFNKSSETDINANEILEIIEKVNTNIYECHKSYNTYVKSTGDTETPMDQLQIKSCNMDFCLLGNGVKTKEILEAKFKDKVEIEVVKFNSYDDSGMRYNEDPLWYQYDGVSIKVNKN